MPGTPPPKPPRRTGGRPMSAAVERKLRDAAMDVLAEQGLAGLTVEKIAARAGVPRSTFYRRWDTAIEAVTAAVTEEMAATNPTDPETGNVKSDLLVMGKNWAGLMENQRFVTAVSFMLAEMEVNPAMRESGVKVARDRRRHAAAVLSRARRLRQIPATADVELLVDVFAGVLFYLTFFRQGPLTERYLTKLIILLTR